MRTQTFDRIKKTVSVLLAVLFVVSLTASAGAACSTSTTSPTTTIPGLSDLNLNNLGNTFGSLNPGNFGVNTNSYGFNPSSTDSDDLSSLFSSLGISL